MYGKHCIWLLKAVSCITSQLKILVIPQNTGVRRGDVDLGRYTGVPKCREQCS